MRAQIIALSAILMIAPAFAQRAATESFVGKGMPSFSMKGLDGKTRTNASLKGKVVLFDFWATWCGPCKAISPMIERIHKSYKGKSVMVVGANVWEKKAGKPLLDGSNAKAYSKEHGYTYPMTYANEALATKLQIQGIPTLVLMDKKGVIRNVYVGFDPKNEAKLKAQIDALLR